MCGVGVGELAVLIAGPLLEGTANLVGVHLFPNRNRQLGRGTTSGLPSAGPSRARPEEPQRALPQV